MKQTSPFRLSKNDLIFTPPKYPANEIKEVLGGRLNKHTREWTLQLNALNVLTLVDWYGKDILANAPPRVKEVVHNDWGFTGWGTDIEKRNEAESHPRWNDLYDFQQEAVEYMTCNPHRGCVLGLDPGLGKAPTSIVAMDVVHAANVLIVAPLTLAPNWMKELEVWSRYYRSWSRATRADKDPKTECVITNHEVLFEPHFYDKNGNDVIIPGGPKKQREWINKGPKVRDRRTGKLVPARKRIVQIRESFDRNWGVIIIDESVLLKNRDAIKVDVLYSLIKYAQYVWLLSGSPTTKFNNDLWPQMKMIQPRSFRSYWRFTEYFCTVDKGQWGWKINGNKPDKPPDRYLKDFLFLRSQKDVLEELPDYIYDPIEVNLTPKQQRAFDEMMADWITMLDDGQIVEASIVLAQQTRAAQITSNLVNIGGENSSGKEDLLMTLLENGDIELPLLIWTWWKPTAASVYNRLYDDTKLDVDYVTGDMKSKDKDEILTDYKTGDLDVLVLQMGVGKYGHTLTDTRTVFYHDRHFDSDAYYQSLRRVRRIGLEHRPRLIVPRSSRSFDPMIEMNLAGKLESIAKLGHKDLKEMLQSLGNGMMQWSMTHES